MKRWKIIVSSLALVICLFFGLEERVVCAANDKGYTPLIEIDLGETDTVVETTLPSYNRYLASKWDAFNSDFFYEQLNESQKSLYQSLYNTCMSYLTTNQTAEAYNSITGFSAKVLIPVGMARNKAEDILLLFSTNNPQFYFINEYYGSGTASNGNYIQIGIYPNWVSGSSRSLATNQIFAKVNEWKAQIDAEPTLLRKEKKAHDLVVTNVTYTTSAYDQSCASVFLDGKAVCAGYAEAFAMLCNAVNIDTISVTSADHEWNLVSLYGNWYNVDCTWDDSDPGFTYTFFNKSDKTIRAGGSHDIESRWANFRVPVALSDNVAIVNTMYEGIDYKAVLDLEYYWNRYPDLRAIFAPESEALLQHFVTSGMQEGRQGIQSFDVNSYRNQYMDLRNAFGNDLKLYYLHYINSGKNEGRQGIGCTTLQGAATVLSGVNYSLVYDYNDYISSYADIKNAFPGNDIAVLQHFVNDGMREGRQGKRSFSVRSYQNQYADLRNAFGNDLKAYYTHYLFNGQREGRQGTGCNTLQGAVTIYGGINYSAIYDYNYYINAYPDMRQNFAGNDVAALHHFVNSGMQEGRQGSANFQINSYMNEYVDLRNAFGNNRKAYYIHYIQNGKAEGRNGKGCNVRQGGITCYAGSDYSSVYDYNYYIKNNLDVKNVFGTDDIAILQHFINDGMREGRQGKMGFNVLKYKGKYQDLNNAFGTDLKSYYLHFIHNGKAEGRTGA